MFLTTLPLYHVFAHSSRTFFLPCYIDDYQIECNEAVVAGYGTLVYGGATDVGTLYGGTSNGQKIGFDRILPAGCTTTGGEYFRAGYSALMGKNSLFLPTFPQDSILSTSIQATGQVILATLLKFPFMTTIILQYMTRPALAVHNIHSIIMPVFTM